MQTISFFLHAFHLFIVTKTHFNLNRGLSLVNSQTSVYGGFPFEQRGERHWWFCVSVLHLVAAAANADKSCDIFSDTFRHRDTRAASQVIITVGVRRGLSTATQALGMDPWQRSITPLTELGGEAAEKQTRALGSTGRWASTTLPVTEPQRRCQKQTSALIRHNINIWYWSPFLNKQTTVVPSDISPNVGEGCWGPVWGD